MGAAMSRHPLRNTGAAISPAWLVALFSVAALALLGALLLRHNGGTTGKPEGELVVFCAAGVKPPVEAAAKDYAREYGIPVQLQYGGSGTLLNNLRISQVGDIYIAADESYVRLAREQNLIAETMPLALQHPVIAVRKGNPKTVRSLDDLTRDGLLVALANPEAASIGKLTKAAMEEAGRWKPLEARVKVFKPTVNDVANDVKLGSVDAGIVWDATVKQYPELEAIASPELTPLLETVTVAVLQSSRRAPAALRFARYLAARDRGLTHFASMGYTPADGDAWAEAPEIVLYSGAMLRPGIEKTLKEFEQREGCRITTVYNGCGVLVAQMRAGERPDAYFSCDTTFMDSVADLYLSPETVVDNNLMILVQKGNPKGIRTTADLAKPGVRLGLPHHEKSAMGNIAWKMLREMGLYDALQPNLKVESPTGDFLVNQLRTGSLDAIIACRSNHTPMRDHLDAIPIDSPLASMAQPYAVGKGTRHRQMMGRLLESLTTSRARDRFTEVGFGWRYQPAPKP